MSQVNLLPPEIRERERTRRLTVLIALAAGAVVALLLVVFVFLSASLSSKDTDLKNQQAVNAGLQSQISGLQQFAELKSEVTAKENLVTSLLQGQVLWSGVLQNISTIIPTQAFLTSLNGTLAATTPGGGATTGLVGSITFAGNANTAPVVADWLTRLESVKGWVNAWVSSITSGTDQAGNVTYTFSSTVDLTSDATTPPKPL